MTPTDKPLPGFIRDSQGDDLIVWRGESSGLHVEVFDLAKTNHGCGFFFAQEKAQADSYAQQGSHARAFKLRANNILDLSDVHAPTNRAFLKIYQEMFDEWVDRYSAEPTCPADLIESGSLYDYEGNGSGARWNCLFRVAQANGYDAVCVLDATDGVVANTWVVFSPEQIVAAEHDLRLIRSARPR